MITGNDIAETAVNSGLIGTPYSKLDCQAFVEVVLEKAGLRIINYRGSNHIWRDLVYDRSPINKSAADDVPAGVLVFKVRFDGGEIARGYHDEMGNAYHVGVNIGHGVVIHSTTGGVQYGKTKDFTDFAYIKDVSYEGGVSDDDSTVTGPTDFSAIYGMIDQIVRDLNRLEDMIYGIESASKIN